MSLQQTMDEDRRLVILRCLSEAHEYSLNESVIEKEVRRLRIGNVDRDLVRADMAWLETHSLVSVDKLAAGTSRELWAATLTKMGAAVARGRPWPGVARPSPA